MGQFDRTINALRDYGLTSLEAIETLQLLEGKIKEAQHEFPSYQIGYGQSPTSWIAEILKWKYKWFGTEAKR